MSDFRRETGAGNRTVIGAMAYALWPGRNAECAARNRESARPPPDSVIVRTFYAIFAPTARRFGDLGRREEPQPAGPTSIIWRQSISGPWHPSVTTPLSLHTPPPPLGPSEYIRKAIRVSHLRSLGGEGVQTRGFGLGSPPHTSFSQKGSAPARLRRHAHPLPPRPLPTTPANDPANNPRIEPRTEPRIEPPVGPNQVKPSMSSQ